ncbi:LysR family transcriptional regulator [Aureimonas sp. Leaf324]|uniref:LysR family transcriptional regulator n=1 Tax=Aureimonas sp. Leaf324 TaxID=1736336 RepID=UPI0006F29DB3|nr:LysR family transcriptional regulator [Aureimonas sp. Leaf324]KQQ85638.1 transcriptional regulator [Aureimonas sp. Leaf324]
MELRQLRCVIAVADEMHFGRAAQKMDMLPAALGRHVRMLEEELGIRLFERTTRAVSLSREGRAFVAEARTILAMTDAVAERFRSRDRSLDRVIRLGAIDSAAAGLVPQLIHDFSEIEPEARIELVEDKTIRLVPRLLSGRLDLAIIRPSPRFDPRVRTRFLLDEPVVLALPRWHPLAGREEVSIQDIADVAMIVPERRSRPHSHDLTIRLFEQAGLRPHIAQMADEKQTIVGMVAAGIGAAIIPVWSARLGGPGVAFSRVREADRAVHDGTRLPLAAAWHAHVRDDNRDRLIAMMEANVSRYVAEADG